MMIKDGYTLRSLQSCISLGKDAAMEDKWRRYLKIVNEKTKSILRSVDGGIESLTEEQRLLLENDFADKNVVDLNERLREQDRKREKKRRHDKISVRGQEALLMQMQSEIEFSWMSCLKNQEWILYPRLLLHIDMITTAMSPVKVSHLMMMTWTLAIK